MIRSPVLDFQGVGAGFLVERWTLPLDTVDECVTRMALIWDDGADNQKVVLLGHTAALELAATLTDYGTEES